MEERAKRWRESQQYHTKFSIIIPMKNAEKTIEKALDSIKCQQYKEKEILIVNDHSDDKSIDKVKTFQESNKDTEIKYFEVKDQKWGPGAGRNVGLDNATGDYILFLDADDELLPDALKNIDEAIKNNNKEDAFILGQLSHILSKVKKKVFTSSKLDKLISEKKNGEKEKADVLLLGHDMQLMKANGEAKKTIKLRPKKFQGTKGFQMGINTGGTIWQGCWKKSLFDENNIRFDENCIFEDTTARLQLYGKAKKIRVPNIATHKYIVRPGQSITTTQDFNTLKAGIEMARRISKLVKEGKVDKKHQKYVTMRLLVMPGTLAWIAYSMGAYKMYKLKEKKNTKKTDKNEKIH